MYFCAGVYLLVGGTSVFIDCRLMAYLEVVRSLAMTITARQIAVKRIARRAVQFPDMEFAPLDTGELDARDAAFASAIDYAVTRRWLTLRTVAQHALDRSWDQLQPKIKARLLAGGAQLLLLDRVPDHAAVAFKSRPATSP